MLGNEGREKGKMKVKNLLFRIEDNQSIEGLHREYEIPIQNLPTLTIKELDKYIAEEIRKEVNNSKDRQLLSYSKSLGVCLLKYNEFADNELHLYEYEDSDYDTISYYFIEDQFDQVECKPFYLGCGVIGLYSKKKKEKEKAVKLKNIVVDVSNDYLLNKYLKKMTGTGKKWIASPEKDKEVLVMQSPNNMIISNYLDSVYLLYALALKYGMNKLVREELIHKICSLENFNYTEDGKMEEEAILVIIDYLYKRINAERKVIKPILQDIKKSDPLSLYCNPIMQLLEIQEKNFDDLILQADYNSNVVSDCIWECYSKYALQDS